MNTREIAEAFTANLEARATVEQSACSDFTRQFVYIRKTATGKSRYHLGLHDKAVSRDVFVARLTEWKDAAVIAEDKLARTVECKAEVLYVPGHEVSVTLKGQRLLHLANSYRYYHVGAIPRGQSGRKEYQGEMVAGPWAFTHEQAAVLSASEAHRKADAAERAEALTVDHGSKVWIDAVEYTVEVERGQFINLVPVK